MKKSMLAVFFGSAALGVAIDLLTKEWAKAALLPHMPVPVLGEVFRFTLGYNPGVAFGFLSGGGPPVLILTGVIILFLAAYLIYLLRSDGVRTWTAVPFGLLLGGALSNFIDRAADGRVTDFLDVGIGASRWPTFNMADVLITIGAVSLLFLTPSERETEKETT